MVSQERLGDAADSVREFIADGLIVEPLFEGPITLEQCGCESEAHL